MEINGISSDEFVKIYRVLLTYPMGIDLEDYAIFRSGFAENVRASYAGHIGTFDGIESLATWMETAHANLDGSLHRITNVSVLAFGEGWARVESYVDALLIKLGHPGGDHFHVHGTYVDDLRLSPSGWLVEEKSFRYVFGSGNFEIVDVEAANEAVARLA